MHIFYIADNTIKVGYAVISADWRSDRSYCSDFRLYTHAAQRFACQIVVARVIDKHHKHP